MCGTVSNIGTTSVTRHGNSLSETTVLAKVTSSLVCCLVANMLASHQQPATPTASTTHSCTQGRKCTDTPFPSQQKTETQFTILLYPLLTPQPPLGPQRPSTLTKPCPAQLFKVLRLVFLLQTMRTHKYMCSYTQTHTLAFHSMRSCLPNAHACAQHARGYRKAASQL